jgi:hypothetical protein
MARNFPNRLVPITEQIDPICLEQACVQTIRQLHYEVSVSADHFDVPGDVLWDVLVHWIVADHMGWDRTPPHLFIVEKEPWGSDNKSRYPHLLRGLRLRNFSQNKYLHRIQTK